MQMQLESTNLHTIQSYSDKEVVIQGIAYNANLIVNQLAIKTDWMVHDISELTEKNIEPLLENHPEIILIGHASNHQIPKATISFLSKQRIGIESMSLGAAIRTFNVLLGEHRVVTLGIIFDHK